MFFIDFVIVLLIAILLSGIFGKGLQRRKWGSELFFFFIILFMMTWAGGVWIKPVGRPVYGSYWVSYLIVGLFVSLLLLATTSSSKRPKNNEIDEMPLEQAGAIGCFVWILVLMTVAPIIIYYA